MTQVRDYKIDIFPCHPSHLFIPLMEGLSVHICPLILSWSVVHYPILSSSDYYSLLPLESSSDSLILRTAEVLIQERGRKTLHTQSLIFKHPQDLV